MEKETNKQTNKKQVIMNVKSRRLSAASEAIRTTHGTNLMLNCRKEQQFRSLALEEIKKVSILTKANSSNKHERQFPTLTDNSKFFAQAKIFFVPADSCINSAKNLAYYEQY